MITILLCLKKILMWPNVYSMLHTSVGLSSTAEIYCRHWEVLACVHRLWWNPPCFPVSDLVAYDSLFRCCHDLDHSSPLQCPCYICNDVLLHQRYDSLFQFLVTRYIHKERFKLWIVHISNPWLTSCNCCIKHSAGWIGNDPLTVVIGESDPYVHISGRVSTSNWINLLQDIAASAWNLMVPSSYQEISHLHTVTILMTAVMIIAFLSSIAIVRRILIATPVLKVSK